MRVPAERGLRQEAGFGLIEVIVSASLLAVIALGIFATIDRTGAVSASNRSRAVAADLAEQDQERMRAFKATDLTNYNGTRTVTVSKVAYTVRSRASWVADKSGTESCTNNSSQADYLKITSTVSWPAQLSERPVMMASVVAPPPGGLGLNRGNLVVQLMDQADRPLAGIPVGLSPTGTSLLTNSQGCAFFGYIAAGSYQATFSQAGWVDPAGNGSVSLNASVTPGTTTMLTDRYAPAAQIAVGFDTKVGAAAAHPAQAQSATVANPGLPVPGTRITAPGSLQSVITSSNLFPFTTGYGVYAGSCPSADPTIYDPTYWSNYPGYVTTTPGAARAVTVREPALNLLATRSGSPLGGAHVIVRATGAGCTEKWTQSTDAQGGLPSPGMPYGTYTACADDGVRSATQVNIANTSPAGTASVPLVVPPSGAGSVCT
jgi:Tfp pilus assembly protein PilV